MVWAGGRLPRSAVGRRSAALGHVSDIFPTLAELAGISGPLLEALATGPAPLDGVSLVAVLRDPSVPSPRTEVLIEGQGWSPDAGGSTGGATEPTPVALAALAAQDPALRCNSTGGPNGMAFHRYRNVSQLPLPAMDSRSADRCAATCCSRDCCTGWALTRPQQPQRGGCTATEPCCWLCCWLVTGGLLQKSADPGVFSGKSGRVPPAPPGPPGPPGPSPPSPPLLPGALRVGDWKLIVGHNTYPEWSLAPEDSPEHAAAAASALCKLGNADSGSGSGKTAAAVRRHRHRGRGGLPATLPAGQRLQLRPALPLRLCRGPMRDNQPRGGPAGPARRHAVPACAAVGRPRALRLLPPGLHRGHGMRDPQALPQLIRALLPALHGSGSDSGSRRCRPVLMHTSGNCKREHCTGRSLYAYGHYPSRRGNNL